MPPDDLCRGWPAEGHGRLPGCLLYVAKPRAGITATGGGVRAGTRASRVSV